MTGESHVASNASRRTLAICVGVALGTGVVRAGETGIPRTPSTIQVTNCDDSGPGSLRDALAMAVSGDTVNLDTAHCSVITLTSGELVSNAHDLIISGIHQTITAGGASRVIEHNGTGRLTISNLVLADGAVSGTRYAFGGCVRSSGELYLGSVTIQDCSVATVPSPPGFVSLALGGGLYSKGRTTLLGCEILDNSVSPAAGIYSYGRGGGVFAHDGLSVAYSTISGNANNGELGGDSGGGFESWGSVYMDYSTVSDNRAYRAAGGEILGEGVSQIRNSTISGNTAQWLTGGIESSAQLFRVWYSTVAFNTVVSSNNGFIRGAGILASGFNGYLNLRSSIIANNSAAGVEDDVGLNGAEVVGHNNLVITSTFPMPPDTLQVDPMLAPLANNGGRTATHALLPGSPAIDAGHDDFDASYDQRGQGYPRRMGRHADIGAYELQDVDHIFANGFD